MNIQLNTLHKQVSQSGNENKVFGYEASKAPDPKTTTTTSKTTGPLPLTSRNITVLSGGGAKTDAQFRTDLYRALSAGHEQEVQYMNELRVELGINAKDEPEGDKDLTGRQITSLIETAAEHTAQHTTGDIDKLFSFVAMDAGAKTMLANFAQANMQDDAVQAFLASGDKGTEAKFRALAALASKAVAAQPSASKDADPMACAYLRGVISGVRLMFDGVPDVAKGGPNETKPADEAWADAVIAEYTEDNTALLTALLNEHKDHVSLLPASYHPKSGETLDKTQQDALGRHWADFKQEMSASKSFRQSLRDLYGYTHGKEVYSQDEKAKFMRNLVFKAFCKFVACRERTKPKTSSDVAQLNKDLAKDQDLGVLKDTVKDVLAHKAHAQTRGGNRCQMLATINAMLQKDFAKTVLGTRLEKVQIDVPGKKPNDQPTKKPGYKLCNPKYDPKAPGSGTADIIVLEEDIANFETDYPKLPRGLSTFEKMLCIAVMKTNKDSFDSENFSAISDVIPLMGLQANEEIGNAAAFKGTDLGKRTPTEKLAEFHRIDDLVKDQNQCVALRVGKHFMAVTGTYYTSETDYGVICIDSLNAQGDKPVYKTVNLATATDYSVYGFGEPKSQGSAKTDERPWTLPESEIQAPQPQSSGTSQTPVT